MEIAAEAQQLVRRAALPVVAGESVKSQRRRSAQRLGMVSRTLERRHRAAWYSESGSWGADLMDDLRRRYEAWVARGSEVGRARKGLARDCEQISERLANADPRFFGADIRALRDMAARLRGVVVGEG